MIYLAASTDYYYYYYGSGDELQYQICKGDVPIYTGKAVAAPGEGVKINIARRIYNWLQAQLADFRTQELSTETGQMATFTLKTADGTTLETYCAIFNGKGAWNGESKYLSQPINGHADRRMKIFVTYATASGGSIIIN